MKIKSMSMSVGIVFLLAVILIAVGSGLFISYGVKMNRYVKTQAVVVDHKTRGILSDDIETADVVQYITPKGVFTATGTYHKNTTSQIGDKVDIAYDPEEPSKCMFLKHTLTAPIFLTSMGGVFLLFGIVIAILRARASKSNAHIEIHGT